MRTVFADTNYWIAITIPNDQWRNPALKAMKELGNVLLLTTEEVLTEFLNLLSGFGPELRQAAINTVRTISDNLNVRVVPQTREGFLKGLELYEERGDKKYSLTDCVSMNVMKSENILEVLTNDHHFTQEGFKVLISNTDK